MKIAFLVLSLLYSNGSEMTQQRPDKLTFKGHSLELDASWAYASPVQLYFYQNRKPYPFEMISTANYRGHIAHLRIESGKLILDSLNVGGVMKIPDDYDIQSSDQSVKNTGVLADWFTGVLVARQKSQTDRYETIATYYFQIENGILKDHSKTEGYSFGSNDRLAKMSINYQSFYIQMESDQISIDGEECELVTGIGRPSPIFSFFGNSFLDWPYNWTNLDKSGAPQVHWLVEDQKLYIKNIQLRQGINFEAEIDTLNLTQEFPGKVMNGIVSANWVSGVFLMIHGKIGPHPRYPGEETFIAKKYTLLRFSKGEIIEQRSVDLDFDFDQIPDTTPHTLKNLITDFKN